MIKFNKKIKNIDKIFLLNLKHRFDRLSFQKQQFLDLGIERFERIDPVIVDCSNNFQNKSVHSCFLSHLKILDLIKKERIFAIILEDDAKISNFTNIENCLNLLFENILDWDMFYFYYENPYKNLDNIREVKSSLLQVQTCINTHAYLINTNKIDFIYEELLSCLEEIYKSDHKCGWDSHIDQVFAMKIHPKIKVYASKENLIYQKRDVFKSDIDWNLEN
jgi:GR25 family glycosyltransferase involved in LPS biosynthesis